MPKLAVIAGDGIGPEVINEALKVLDIVESLIGPRTITSVPPDTLRQFEDHGTAQRTLPEEARMAEEAYATRSAEPATVALADRTHVLANGELRLTLTPDDAADTDRMVAGPQAGMNALRSTKVREDANWKETISVHPVVRTHPETVPASAVMSLLLTTPSRFASPRYV